MHCRNERQLSGYINSATKTWTVVIDVEAERKARFIRKINEMLGSTEKCKCIRCNPDTSN